MIFCAKGYMPHFPGIKQPHPFLFLFLFICGHGAWSQDGCLDSKHIACFEAIVNWRLIRPHSQSTLKNSKAGLKFEMRSKAGREIPWRSNSFVSLRPTNAALQPACLRIYRGWGSRHVHLTNPKVVFPGVPLMGIGPRREGGKKWR